MPNTLDACKCGADLNKSFEIKKLWTSYKGMSLYICYCNRCTEYASFSDYTDNYKNIMPIAVNAWNSKPK